MRYWSTSFGAALLGAAGAPEPEQPTAWRIFAEGAASRAWADEPLSSGNGLRAALDIRWDTTPFTGLRAVLSDRLDVVKDDAGTGRHTVNSLREAYVSWQGRPDVIVDAGRANLRNGVAWGYNPTDFFKAGALRMIVSPDPARLRENRLGTVLFQAQKLWTSSSLSAVYSPKLASTPTTAAFSPDFGATNSSNRWLLSSSYKFNDTLNPQLLVYGGEHLRPQVGLNVSTLLNSATIAFVEYSAGKGRSLVAQSLAVQGAERWRQRAALGATYTTPFNLSLTAEGDFNSAAPSRARWEDLAPRLTCGRLALCPNGPGFAGPARSACRLFLRNLA